MKKKKKRSRASKKGSYCASSVAPPPQSNNHIDEDKKVIESLVAAFGSISFKEAEAAYREAKGDAIKAAEVLGNLFVESPAEDQSTTCSSSSGNFASGSGSSSGSSGSSFASEVFSEANVGRNGVKNQKGRQKKVVAAAGIVSTMLGKDYVRSVQKRSSSKSKRSWSKDEAEQFLCSMLGEDCQLGMAVVSDVLCGCGYDVEKALNVLLELSSSLADKSDIGNSDANIREDACSNLEGNSSQLTDRTSDSTPYSPESKFPENVGYMELIGRSHFQVLHGIDSQSSKSPGHMEPELTQQVLESLFNMPTPKSAEQEPNTMNWRNIVKKMTSLGQGIHPGDGAPMQYSPAKGDDYQVFRQSAKQHWESMKLCYQKAATAFSNGERDYAAILSEQGRTHNKMAREAEEKASQDIFKARNKGIENMITIDLHGQHVKPAMRLLKLHLLFGAYVRSVRSFRVITGCGRHGVGKSKLKQSVINILEREGIEWSEENSGTLLIRLDQQTDFTFLDSDSEGE